MGLRHGGEKPATVLRLIYTLGWLPALLAAYALRPGEGLPTVLSGAGARGATASAGLAASLAILTCGYSWALRHPPGRGELLAAAAGSLAAALAMPLLFSADVYAYAYYGDELLHGQNPYAHAPFPPAGRLAAAAVAAWDGRVPPRCVYGPLAVALASFADAAGSAGGPNLQIALQRLSAAAAYAAYAFFVLRLTAAPRARAALLLNPVVIWSVAEGHNDAAMTALAAAGVAATRGRALWFAAAALVKAPALLLVWTKLLRLRDRPIALAAAFIGYLPLFFALVGETRRGPGEPTTAWESPLGCAAALLGRGPAVACVLCLLAAAAVAARRLPAADRAPALALAAWFALPNAYPWYALWIVPLAARRPGSAWSRALLAAALVAPVRVVTDAVFGASESLDAAPSLHLGMIAFAYLPPLAVIAFGARRAASTATLVAIAIFFGCCRSPATAQTAAPSPLPAAAPATPAASASPALGTQQPAPTAAPQPVPASPPSASPSTAPEPLPQPAPTVVPQLAPTAAPQPVPTGPLAPAGATAAPGTAAGTGTPSPAPAMSGSAPAAPPAGAPSAASAALATPNPFGYIITPAPVPATMPDGPHIIQVDVNDRRIRAGGPLLVRVFTSTNVVGVEARALGRFIPIPQSSPGLFALAYTMPIGIPFWLLNRNYDIVIAAATADGRQTSVTFPMLLTR